MELTDANFQSYINSNELVLVDFYSPTCGPCRTLAPIIDRIAPEYAKKGLKIVKMNTRATTVWQKLGVRSVPSLMIFKDGKLFQKLLIMPITEKSIRNALSVFV